MRLGEPQSRSGRYGEETKLQSRYIGWQKTNGTARHDRIVSIAMFSILMCIHTTNFAYLVLKLITNRFLVYGIFYEISFFTGKTLQLHSSCLRDILHD
jgi:hypothetical protein